MSAPTFDLGKLHGGLRLPGEKEAATGTAIQEVPLPGQLILPLTQHVGDQAQPVPADQQSQCGGPAEASADIPDE